MNRRDWLRIVGAGAAAGAMVGCRDDDADNAASATSAAIVLEPTHESMLVSVWSADADGATIEVRDSGALVHAARVAISATRSAVVDVIGLAAARAYDVQVVMADGTRLPPTTARTAPHDDDPRPVRLAVVADCDPSPEFANGVLGELADADADVCVAIGDVPYTDNGPVAKTVDEYRRRHADLRTAPHLRAWLGSTGLRAIYDDHEFRNDWDASWVAKEPARYAAAMQVWDEFFPLRNTVGDVRYRHWKWGANVECFMLDCRRFRSANAAPDDATKTMLGAAQRAWLVQTLPRSNAPFKLVFTSIPLGFGLGNDHWTTFSTERDQLFAAIAAARIPGVLFVSGDQHYFAAHRHAHGLREFQIGPIARGLGTPGPNAPGVLFRHVAYNAGIVDIAHDRLTFAGVGADGARFYEETFTPEQLRPV